MKGGVQKEKDFNSKLPMNEDLSEILGDHYRAMDSQSWAEVPFWIPTGAISLDYAIMGYRGLKGGIPHGRTIEIWGPESGGKSALLDHIIREFINMGGIVLLGDREHSHEEKRMREIGINPALFRFIEKPREKVKPGELPSDFYLEEFFDLTLAAFKKIRAAFPDIPILVALDSLAATPTKDVYNKEYDELTLRDRLDKSVAMSVLFPQFCGEITTSNATFIVVNQLRQRPGITWGDADYSPGGKAKDFMFSLRIKLDVGTPIKGSDDPSIDQLEPDPVGLLCKFRIYKNKVAPPLRTGGFWLMFDSRGIFHEATFANLLLERKCHERGQGFEKSGSWYVWKEETIGQGFKGLVRYFMENPDVMLEMEQELFAYAEPETEKQFRDSVEDKEVEEVEEVIVPKPKRKRGKK